MAPRQLDPSPQQKEGFCQMLYICEKCGNMEILWNSRNGVTPFMIGCRACGKTAQHAHWQLDRYMPNYIPFPGQRVFVDLTIEKFKEYEAKRVNTLWDHKDYPMSERFESKQQAFEQLTKDFDAYMGIREQESL